MLTPHHDQVLLSSLAGVGDYIGEMADYPVYEFSSSELVRVGNALRDGIPYRSAEDMAAAVRIFRVAYSWRDSHAYAMRRIKHELMGNVRKGRKSGITSARLKRMASIKRKLAHSTTKFNQMQDLGGCRAIMRSRDEMATMIDLYRSGGTTHTIRTDTDYIASPRSSGYRGHHFVLAFRPEVHGEEQFSDRRVELQIRTRLQHAWSTAVEAVGTARNEELKSGRGDPDWLRLFALMSSEIAEDENCPIVPGTPALREERRAEILSLDNKLGAVQFLDNINDAFDVTGTIREPHVKFFLIQIDNRRRTIRIQGFGRIGNAADAYSAEERSHADINTVLVEVDKVGNLKEAYPNYFMDVGLFTGRMRKALGLSGATVPRNPRSGFDLSWLRAYTGQG